MENFEKLRCQVKRSSMGGTVLCGGYTGNMKAVGIHCSGSAGCRAAPAAAAKTGQL